MLKTCKRGHCEEAYVNKRGVSECRKCRSERVTAWRERNIDKAREQKKVYMRKKRATEPEKMAEQLSKWFDANPSHDIILLFRRYLLIQNSSVFHTLSTPPSASRSPSYRLSSGRGGWQTY